MLSLSQYHSIFNTVNEVNFVHDVTTGEVLEISEKCIEMYGYSPR